jgi:hypothetical protein
MSTIQDQYTAIAKQGQEAATAVAGAWTRSIQDSMVKLPTVSGQAAVQQIVDQVFDFAATVIDVQRNLTKQLVSSSAILVEEVTQRAGTVATEATENVTKATRRATKTNASE